MKLPLLSIRHPVATTALVLTLVFLGFYGLANLKVDFLPSIVYPLVKVQIVWKGATPQEIEDNIATPVERALGTIDNLDYLDSSCLEGAYKLNVNFLDGTDVDIAFQDVVARLNAVSRKLPSDIEPPSVVKADPSQLPIVEMVVSSETMDQVKLRTWVDNYLQYRFIAVHGVAAAEVSGGLLREIRVNIDQRRLQSFGLSLAKVIQTLKDENLEQMGGRAISTSREFTVRTTGEYQSLSDIRQVVVSVTPQGQPVYLSDIGTVEDTHEEQRIIARLNSKPCVKLSISKQAAANTVEVDRAIRQRLQQLIPTLPEGVHIDIVYGQADYINAAISSVRDAAFLAALLVVLVILFFLTGLRRIIIVVMTLPLSLLAALFMMHLAGYSLNLFSLGGLTVAIIVVLDNCVVVLENITRIQETQPDRDDTASAGAAEVASAVFFSTLTFLAIFLPFLLVSGMASLLFRELVIIVATTIIASTLLALSVTPMLAARWLVNKGGGTHRENRLMRWSNGVMDRLLHIQRQALEWSLRHKLTIIVLSFLFFVTGLVLLRWLGSEFLPRMDDGRVMVKVRMPSGASLSRTDRVLRRIEDLVREDPHIENYFTLAGGKVERAVTYEVANEGEVDIKLVPRAKRNISTDQYLAWLSGEIKKATLPGARIKVMRPTIAGIKSTMDRDVEIQVRGEDLETLSETADALMGSIRDIPNLQNLDTSLDITKPEYQIVVDRQRAADRGLSVTQIANTVRGLVDGLVATEYRKEGWYYDLRARIQEGSIRSLQDIQSLSLSAPRGGMVNLGDVATVVRRTGPLQIDRQNQIRQISVTGDAMGRSIGEVTKDVRSHLSAFNLPSGYELIYAGQSRLMAQNAKSLGLVLLLALFFGYVVLAIQFESFIEPFLILIRVPLSLIGVAAALVLTRTPVGATVAIGIVLLAGIEIYHGVVLIAYIDQLRRQGRSLDDAIREGTTARLRPILMTLIVGIMGLLPLALGLGEGVELLRPMAIAMEGGLLFSIFLTLLVLPVLYALMVRKYAV